jgi:hypothetical protein
MKKNDLDMETIDIMEFIGKAFLTVVFFWAWISWGSLIVAIGATFLAMIPMAFVLIPSGVIIGLVRGK